MQQRLISTLSTALVAVSLVVLTPAVQARQIGPTFIYTLDKSALTAPKQSPQATVSSAVMFEDTAPSPNLNGWVCASDSDVKGACTQTTMGPNTAIPTLVKVAFTNQTTHATAWVPVSITKFWMSVNSSSRCSLSQQHGLGVGINDQEAPPTTPGDCSHIAPTIQFAPGAMNSLTSAGVWTGELSLHYMALNGTGEYIHTRDDTASFQITVTDNDGSSLALSTSFLSFPAHPSSGSTASMFLYLYDPNHGLPSEAPLQLRLWDDQGITDPAGTTFTMVTQYGGAQAGLESTLSYTVGLTYYGGTGPFPPTIQNGRIYTIGAAMLSSAGTVACPSPNQGQQCIQVGLKATLLPFDLIQKSSSNYNGRLHIAFGVAL